MFLILINMIFHTFLVGIFFQFAHSIIMLFLQLGHSTSIFARQFHPDFYYLCAFYVVFTFTTIGYSPIGSFISTVFLKARKAKGTDLEYISSNLEEVLIAYNKNTNQNLTAKDFNLFINNSEVVNAMALGHKTIVVTAGLLRAEPEMLQTVLAHELGHLHYGDSMVSIAIIAGSYPIQICYWANYIFMQIARVVVMILRFIPILGLMSALFMWAVQLACLPLIAINWIGNKIFDFVYLMNCRKTEYRADEFASNLRYGDSMIRFLEYIAPYVEQGNIFTQLFSTHPLVENRIERLQKIKVQN